MMLLELSTAASPDSCRSFWSCFPRTSDARRRDAWQHDAWKRDAWQHDAWKRDAR